MFISLDENGRITASAEKEEYLIDPIEFDFPEDFDFSTIGEYVVENGELKYSRSQESIKDEIADYQAKLNATDWVVIKINEAMIKGENVSALTMKYADIIGERDKYRLKINELEELI